MKSEWKIRVVRMVCGLICGIGCVGISGCVNQGNTRLPTIDTPPSLVEKQSYRLHDPFPEEDLGPDTMTRPRGFTQPRAQPRKNQESRALLGLDQPQLPPNSFNYSNTVRQ